MSNINIVLENRDDIHVAVEEKDINVEVPAGKDGRSLRPRGEWDASVAYAYLDLVSYDGSSYAALKAVPAGTLPTDTSYWMLLAEKGEPGTPEWGNITGNLSDQTDLQEALDAKADVIISSASGSIASFSDGSASPVTALTVGIEPVQDLHGYDAPWPAGGGKNKFDISGISFTDGIRNADGSHQTSSSSHYTSSVPVLPNTQYTISGTMKTSSANWRLYYLGESESWIERTDSITSDVYTFTTPSTCYYIQIQVPYQRTLSDCQLELGSSATSWTPYSNICPITGHTACNIYNEAEYDPTANPKVTIDLDGTRYSSVIDVLAGTMTVDRVCKTLTTARRISTTYPGSIIYNNQNPETSDADMSKPLICNRLKYAGNNSWNFVYGTCINASGQSFNLWISDTAFADVNAATAWLQSNETQICYYLAQPITVQLSPSQMSTLKGQNHLWSDTGDTAVEYRADTKLYIDGKFSQLQALILEN